MKQSEFKKRYDVKMGRYVKKHIYWEGVVTDVFKTIGRKLFGKTVKEVDQFSFLGNRARYEFIELDMSTGLDVSIPISRPLTLPGGQSKNGYQARWLVELGFSREEKKWKLKQQWPTWSTKCKMLSRSQFVMDKRHCVAGRLMLFWYFKKNIDKKTFFFTLFSLIYLTQDYLPSRARELNDLGFKMQTSHQPCFPCKNRIHLKRF